MVFDHDPFTPEEAKRAVRWLRVASWIGYALIAAGAILVVSLLALGARQARAAEIARPVILVAKPDLREFYQQSVVFAMPFGHGGHVGFILNRPTKATLSKLFPDHRPSSLVADVVMLGGPVNAGSVNAIVRSPAPPSPTAIPLVEDAYMVYTARDVDDAIEKRGNAARYLVGLVMWDPGELEQELARGFWFVLPARADMLFDRDHATLWGRMRARTGPSVRIPHQTSTIGIRG